MPKPIGRGCGCLDARSKLAIWPRWLWEKLTQPNLYGGIRRIMPVDFEYAHQLKHTIRCCVWRGRVTKVVAIGAAESDPQSAILAQSTARNNAVWIRGVYGEERSTMDGARARADWSRGGERFDARAREIRHGSRNA